MRFKIQSSI